MPKQDRLNAVILSGIQDTPGDWDALREEGKEVFNVHALPSLPPAAGKECETWIRETIEAEVALVRSTASRIIIAHSFGAHRVFEVMKECPEIETAVILSPAANVSAKQQEAISHPTRAQIGTFVDDLLRPLTLDINDDDYLAMHERHAQSISKQWEDIRAMLKFLSKGLPFAERLSSYRGDRPILIFQSKLDPFFVKGLSSNSNVSVVNLPNETLHYPHISRVQFIADTAKMRFKEIGILQESEFRSELEERKESANKVEVAA